MWGNGRIGTVGTKNPLQELHLAFIGAGAMGEAMINGLLSRHQLKPDNITASDKHLLRLREIRKKFHIHISQNNRAAAKKGSIVVLAVKPQVLPVVFRDLKKQIKRDALVVSIVAGVTIETIAKGLEHRAIVRTMPNTPSQIGEGMTVWTATPQVTALQRQQAQAVVEALGRQLYADDENMLDMATAISGSGPAYVFLLMEALIDAGVHLGFSRADARELVVQTIRGSALFADQSTVHPAEMRNMVTSPGGTSAAALYQLEKGAFRTAVSKAVLAAYQRSVSLGLLGNSYVAEEKQDSRSRRMLKR